MAFAELTVFMLQTLSKHIWQKLQRSLTLAGPFLMEGFSHKVLQVFLVMRISTLEE